MKRETLRETGIVFANGLLWRNPVLTAALGLYPAAVCGSLSQSVPLSALLVAQSLLAGLLFCAFGAALPDWLRPGAALALSALCWTPAALLTERLFPGSAALPGAVLVLQIANSMVLSRLNEYAPTHIFPAVAADVLGCTLGSGLLLCAQAALRAVLRGADVWTGEGGGSGWLGGAPALPFFGFLILGFLAAAVQAHNLRRTRHAGKRRVTRL